MTDYDALMNRYTDELNDVSEYVDLAKMASDSGERQILKDIAKEEFEHAHSLKFILKHSGHYDSRFADAEERATTALKEV